MWNLICASIFLLIQGSSTAAFTLELIPADECDDVQCPQLSCPNTILKEGSCCKSCIIAEEICVKDEIVYEEGSIIPLNSTDACDVCHCSEGKFVYGNVLESCPRLKCDKSQRVKEEGKCCARCLNENNVFSAQPKATCTENGITYQEGDVWNPYFSKFGVVKCQKCTCKNSTTSCKAVSCPPVRACTTDDPVEEITTCCPKCNRMPSQQQNTTSKDNSTYSVPTLVPEKPTESNITCPLVYLYKIYQTINTSIDQIAIEHMLFSSVDVYVWSPKFKSVKYEPYSGEVFERKHLNTRFKYVGDATAEAVKAVKDWFRIKKKKISLYYCKRNCSTRVLKLLEPCK